MKANFDPPTPEELSLQAAKIGLPESQAQQFLCYYASKNWLVGKSPMKNWRMALSGWKLRWEEKRSLGSLSTAHKLVLASQELQRVEKAMSDLRHSYSEHQSWSDPDRAKFVQLRSRRDELKSQLGFVI